MARQAKRHHGFEMWPWVDILLALPVLAGLALLVASVFLSLGVPDGPHGDLSADGHVALRLTILIGAVVTAVLMRLMFLSHESGLDRDVDEGRSGVDGRPIRSWQDGGPVRSWWDGAREDEDR